MISNKTAATLFLITLGMKTIASTNPSDTQEPSSSNRPALPVRKQRSVPKANKNVLVDTTNVVSPVEVENEGTEKAGTLQGQSVLQVNQEFEKLIDQEKYKEILELGEKMEPREFFDQLLLSVTTPEQYKRLVSYLETHNLVTLFFVQGDIGVFKRAIIKSEVYDNDDYYYAHNGDLDIALFLALKMDCHEHVIDLLKMRQEITAEKDEELERMNALTSFGAFVSDFLFDLASWKNNGMAFKRFLVFGGNEFGSKYPDIFDLLCKELVDILRSRPDDLNSRKLLTDLIAQPSILTPGAFTWGFLWNAVEGQCSDFIKYAWDEAVGEGLTNEYPGGREYLWGVMGKLHPDRFLGEYPDTDEALAAVLKYFPTKQKLEEQWIMDNAPGFLETIGPILANIFPDVLVSIVIEYARPTWIDSDVSTVPEE